MKNLNPRSSSIKPQPSYLPQPPSSPPSQPSLPLTNHQIHSKLLSEINTKNSIILDLTTKQSWLSSQIPDTLPPSINNNERTRLFALLDKFRTDLEQAKDAVQQNKNYTSQLEKHRQLAEQEVHYYRNLIGAIGVDPNTPPKKLNVLWELERNRIVELQELIHQKDDEISKLSLESQNWAKVVKNIQESKQSLEACKSALEMKLAQASKNSDSFNHAQLSANQRSIDSTQDQLLQKIHSLEQLILQKDEKILKTEYLFQDTKAKVASFESNLEEAYNSVEAIENEKENLLKTLQTKEKLVIELKDQIAALLEDEAISNAASENAQEQKKITGDLEKDKEQLSMSIQKLTKDLVSQQKIYRELNMKYSKIESEKSDLIVNNKNLQNELNRLISNNNQELAFANVSKDQRDLDVNLKNQQESDELAINLQNQIIILSQKLESYAEFPNQIEELKEEIEDLHTLLQRSEDKNNLLEVELSKAKQNKDLESELNNLKETLNLKNQEIVQLQNSLQENQTKSINENNIPMLEQEIDMLENQIIQLQTSNDELQKSILVLEDRIVELQSGNEAQFKTNEKELKDALDHIHDLENQIVNSKQSENLYRMELEDLREDGNSANIEDSLKLREDLENSQMETERLTAELENALNMAKETHSLKEEMESLSKLMEHMNIENSALQKKIEQQSNLLVDSEDQKLTEFESLKIEIEKESLSNSYIISELKMEISNLKLLLEKKQQEMDILESEVALVKTENVLVQSKLESAEADLTALRSEKDPSRIITNSDASKDQTFNNNDSENGWQLSEINDLRKEIESQTEDLCKLTDENNLLHDELEKLDSEKMYLQSEIILLNEQLEESIQKLKITKNISLSSPEKEVLDLRNRNLILEEQLANFLDTLETDGSVSKNSKTRNALTNENELDNDLMQELRNEKEKISAINVNLLEHIDNMEMSAVKMESQISDLSLELEISRKKILYYEQEVEKFEKRINELQDLEGRILNDADVIHNLESQLDSIKSEKSFFESESHQNQEIIKSLRDKIKELEEMHDKINSERENVDDVSANTLALEKELDLKLQELNNLQSEHGNLSKLFNVLKTELDNKDSETRILKENLEAQTRKLESEKTIAEFNAREIQDLIEALNEKKPLPDISEQLHEELQDSRGKIHALEIELDSLKKVKASEDNKSEISLLYNQINDLNSQIQALEMKSFNSTDEIKTYQSLLAKEQEENVMNSEKLKLAEDKLKLLNDKILDIEAKLTKAKNELVEMETVLNDSQAQCELMSMAIKDSDSREEKFNIEQKRISNKNMDLENQINELKSSNDQLMVQLQKMGDRLAQADNDRRSPIEFQPDKSAELLSVINECEKNADALRKTITELQKEIETSNERISSMMMEKANREEEFQELNMENQSLMKKVEELGNQMRDLKSSFMEKFPGSV